MIGGAGNDTYIVDDAGDVVLESAGAGTDAVLASVTFAVPANVENLTLTGAAATNGSGNSAANTLVGNAADNTLDGGGGNDTLVGGLGNDTYLVDSTADVVTEAANAGIDVVRSTASFTLGANVENLVLVGVSAINGTGNTIANVMTGNDADNILNGGSGADTMDGGLGNDTYVVDNLGDTVIEAANAGIDLVQAGLAWTLGANVENLTLTGTASIAATGNALANLIVGNAGANRIDGGAGADTMVGGAGDDTYVVDSSGDVVTESTGAGTDLVQSSVSYTLGANIEKLTLTGNAAIDATGNTLANVLTGNGGDNVLDGAGGADTLIGGSGNDTYVVDNAGDVVTEAAGGGVDLVRSSVSFTLGANVENLMLTGATAINATGNSLANALTGNSGSNVLNGGSGADTMAGGLGNDTYVVDNAGDVLSEAAGAGTDLVQASVSYALPAGGREHHADRERCHRCHRQRRREQDGRQLREQSSRRRSRCRHDDRRRRKRHICRRQQGRLRGRALGWRRRHRGVVDQLGSRSGAREPDPDRQRCNKRHRQRPEQRAEGQRRQQPAERQRRQRHDDRWSRQRHLRRRFECRRRFRGIERRHRYGPELAQLRSRCQPREADPDRHRSAERHRQLAGKHDHRKFRQQRARRCGRSRFDGRRSRQRHLHRRQRWRHRHRSRQRRHRPGAVERHLCAPAPMSRT